MHRTVTSVPIRFNTNTYTVTPLLDTKHYTQHYTPDKTLLTTDYNTDCYLLYVWLVVDWLFVSSWLLIGSLCLAGG